MARLTPEELAAFVAVSCERQGVPVKVTDARVLGEVVTLLRGDHPDRTKRRAVVAGEAGDRAEAVEGVS